MQPQIDLAALFFFLRFVYAYTVSSFTQSIRSGISHRDTEALTSSVTPSHRILQWDSPLPAAAFTPSDHPSVGASTGSCPSASGLIGMGEGFVHSPPMLTVGSNGSSAARHRVSSSFRCSAHRVSSCRQRAEQSDGRGRGFQSTLQARLCVDAPPHQLPP